MTLLQSQLGRLQSEALLFSGLSSADSGLPTASLGCSHRKEVSTKSIGLIETTALALEER